VEYHARMDSRAEHERWMHRALEQADIAFDNGEVPIGCVIVQSGRIIGRGCNRVEASSDASAHAEMIAISAASATVGDWRLDGAIAYVTVEPCLMCAGALLLARVERVVYGAPEPKFGAFGSRADVRTIPGLNHQLEVETGVLGDLAAERLRAFFRLVRRDGRVVEGGGLENRCGGNPTEGSNPSLSASCSDEDDLERDRNDA
jgi:tRNA(adenine34) deaminase